jgi:hypothetical protein
MRRAIRHLLLLAAVAALLPSGTAVASPADVHRDCADDGALQGSYSDAQLSAALERLPGDLDEYSDCRAIIGAAIGGPKGKAAGSGRLDADLNDDGKVTPAERRTAAKRKAKREQRRQLASLDETLPPGAGPADLVADDGDDGMPLPLLLVLIALVCLGIAGATWYAARSNPAIANALRRIPLPGRRG